MEKSVMKAWKVHQKGIENAIMVEDEPFPQIKDDHEVVIKVVAVALNPVDYKYPDWDNVQFPYIPGLDVCGLVAKKGSQVTSEIEEGKTIVLCHSNLFKYNGGCAEYSVHDSRYLSIVKPNIYEGKDINHVLISLASLPTAGFTAYQDVCHKLSIPLNASDSSFCISKVVKYIFVSAGAGGVGGFCLQLLNIWRQSLSNKAEVKILTTCSKSNFDYVISLGATDPIDYQSQNLKEAILELTNNEGVDYWIENISEKNGQLGIECLRFGGELVTNIFGQYDLKTITPKSLSLHYVFLGGAYMSKVEDRMHEIKLIGDNMLKLFEDGKLTKTKVTEIAFAEIKESLVKMKEGHTQGKLVALISEL